MTNSDRGSNLLELGDGHALPVEVRE